MKVFFKLSIFFLFFCFNFIIWDFSFAQGACTERNVLSACVPPNNVSNYSGTFCTYAGYQTTWCCIEYNYQDKQTITFCDSAETNRTSCSQYLVSSGVASDSDLCGVSPTFGNGIKILMNVVMVEDQMV